MSKEIFEVKFYRENDNVEVLAESKGATAYEIVRGVVKLVDAAAQKSVTDDQKRVLWRILIGNEIIREALHDGLLQVVEDDVKGLRNVSEKLKDLLNTLKEHSAGY